MNAIRICLYLLLCGPVVAASSETAKPSPDPNRWEQTIREFEQWDEKNSFPEGGVLFVGSSSIRMWPTRKCFADLPVINRGFGGSHISDVNHYFDRVVLPYSPSVIVFYAGDNDVAGGKSPQRVFDDYRRFVRLVLGKLPRTRIIFITIKPSLSRWSLWPKMRQSNRMIRAFCDSDRLLYFADAATCLLGEDGKPDSSLFLDDKLHLSAAGYRLWTRTLAPMIEQARERGR